MTRVCWRGLLSSELTQGIVDALMYATPYRPWCEADSEMYSCRKKLVGRAAFAAVTIHGVPTVAVPYIPPSSPLSTPMRLPRPDSEDTWTLLASSHGVASGSESMCRWVLAESIGKWDSRWG